MRVSLWVACVSVPLYAQSFYYLPQVVDGATAAGSLRTSIILTNVDTATATVGISLTRDDGSPRPLNFPGLGLASQFTLALAPGASRILQTDGTGDGSAGAAVISSSAALGVSTILSAYDSNANPLSESGASGSDVNSAYLIPIDTTGGPNTGVAIFNPAASTVALTFTLFDVNGATLESTTATLAAGAHTSRLAAGDLFPDIPSMQGTMSVSSSVPVAAVAFRQNAAAPSYTLLDAVPQSSFGVNFYLPQIADGPTPSGGALQTTFLLYNLNPTPTTVTLSLAQASAVPWTVNIPGLGNNSTFTVTLAAGGSAFLQTDGQGASTTGAAAISSTQPIGISAIVTATDADGNFLSETAMPPSPVQQKFLLAFDTTNGINTGLALFNPASQPVTLTVNQLDPTGNLVASAQSQPIAPGAHMTAYITDLFPAAMGLQGALSVTATGWVGASVAALALRRNATPLAMAATPPALLPVTGPALNITSTLDPKSVASAPIPPAGGTLSLTDGKGNKFTLTIPANALRSTTTVTMTAVTALAGLPPGGSFNAGVQLDPDGLALNQPALLTIEPANPPAPDTIIPLGWHGGGQGVYLNIVQPQNAKLTMALNHFSGAAIGSGADSYLTSQLLQVANKLELDQSQIAYWINKQRTDQLIGSGEPNPADMQHVFDIFSGSYGDIQAFMKLALDSQDDNTLLCAANYAVGYERFREIAGNGAPNDAVAMAIANFFQQASNILMQHLSDQCRNSHDPLAGFNLVNLFSGLSFANLQPLLQQCSPAPTLTFQSEMTVTANVSLISGTGNSAIMQVEMAKIDLTLAANPTLTGTVSQGSFNGTGDGYTTYMLTGSGPAAYKASSGNVTATDTAGSTAVTCTGTFTGGSGSTLSVISPSQIQYQFTSRFNPASIMVNGQQFAQFCPVYTTTPVSVSLTIDPGMPTESFSNVCSAPGQPPLPPETYWLASWDALNNANRGPAAITGWQIPGAGSFAHKDISLTQTIPFTPPPGTSGTSVTVYTEKTSLDLNQPQQ